MCLRVFGFGLIGAELDAAIDGEAIKLKAQALTVFVQPCSPDALPEGFSVLAFFDLIGHVRWFVAGASGLNGGICSHKMSPF